MRLGSGRLLVACLLLSGCATPAVSDPSARAELTVFAAASLSGALDRVAAAYPAASLMISTDSSATLATQIEQGAPADVFLAADTTTPQRLVAGALAAGDPVVFAGNELTIVVPRGNPAAIATPADLARPDVKVVAAGEAVPITGYADRLISNLATQPGYPDGFVAGYVANVATREDNVKAVVTKVELGEGDAAIVYATDALTADVDTIRVPSDANVRADYAGIVVRTSRDQTGSRAFLDWLSGPAGQAILAGFGFLPPP